jgi:Tol biopolymer transport system component
MSRPTRRKLVIAVVSAATAVLATLAVVNLGDDSARVRATRGVDNSTPAPVRTATTSGGQPADLAPPTAVRTPTPVRGDGCSGATDEVLRGDLIGVTTNDGVEELSIDGTHRFRVDGPTGQYSSPSWSADGRSVAFNVGGWQDEPRPSIGIADIASHCWKVWPRGRDAYTEPSLSNDASKVAYNVGPNGSTLAADLRGEMADADGRHAQRLPGRLTSAAWAPDDSGRFAYSDLEGLKVLDRSGATTLLHEVTDAEFAAWSPDASRLAYSVSTNAGVWVAQADGSDRRKLVEGIAEIFFMSWSPDGKEIAYERHGGVWIVSANGGDPRQIPGAAGVAGWPRWALDGQSILYTEGSIAGGGPSRVLAIPLEGGTPRVVVENAVLAAVFHRK